MHSIHSICYFHLNIFSVDRNKPTNSKTKIQESTTTIITSKQPEKAHTDLDSDLEDGDDLETGSGDQEIDREIDNNFGHTEEENTGRGGVIPSNTNIDGEEEDLTTEIETNKDILSNKNIFQYLTSNVNQFYCEKNIEIGEDLCSFNSCSCYVGSYHFIKFVFIFLIFF